jgi:tetratricopeptide (TPR) repeat protein
MQKQKWFISSPRRAIVSVALILVSLFPVRGQVIRIDPFRPKPKFPVTIQHPANLSVSLTGKKVAFGPVATGCPQQFEDLIMQDFVQQGVTLVNRADLDAVLAEHQFQASVSVDPATAVQLGKVLGPSVIVFLNVTRCEARKDGPLYQDQIGTRISISRTEAHFLASIHTVDLTTGRELGVNEVRADPKRENTARFPAVAEYPGEFEVQDAALRTAADRAHRLYFPWTETRQVSFMNNKECNLKQAYDILKAGDLTAALKLSEENITLCKSDPKAAHQADALYNLGVAYMLNGDFDKALDTLTESERTHDDKTTIATIKECREAKTAASASAAREAQTADEQKTDQTNQQRRDATTAQQALTNETIIEYAKSGTSDELLIKLIATKAGTYALLPKDIAALKQAGVSDKVIAAMMDKK